MLSYKGIFFLEILLTLNILYSISIYYLKSGAIFQIYGIFNKIIIRSFNLFKKCKNRIPKKGTEEENTKKFLFRS